VVVCDSKHADFDRKTANFADSYRTLDEGLETDQEGKQQLGDGSILRSLTVTYRLVCHG
jgi:hypothetical protein